MRLLMVFNPHACFGRAARLLPVVRAALQRFAELDLCLTRCAGDARAQVAAVDLAGYDGVLAAGGDGTLFEVLNGLYAQAPERRPPLGVVPVGTGNAFARDLGLQPGDWRRGVELIAAGRTREVDVGRVEPADRCASAGAAGDSAFHFLNIVGAGLPVDAMRAAERIKFVGRSAYSAAALWCAMRLRSYPLVLEMDGERFEEDALFVEISNTRYTGTSFLMAPSAQLDDGLLDVTLVRRLPRVRLLRLFPTIYRGGHVAYAEVTTRRAREVTLLAPGGLELAPDGEIRGHLPSTVRCLHRDLRIFA